MLLQGRGFMERRLRIWIKVIIVAVLSLLFIWLIYTDEKVLQLEQPEGEPVLAEDVLVLLTELKEAGAAGITDGTIAPIRDILAEKEDGSYLQYKDYLEILDILSQGAGTTEDGPEPLEKLTYKNKYRGSFYLLKKDWYKSYEQIVRFYGMEEVIRKEKIEILCGSRSLAGEERVDEG